MEQSSLTVPEKVYVSGWQNAVSAAILGWVLDAFDFFVVIFLLDTLSGNFHIQKRAIVWTISLTLATRPVGALLFGALADRIGRRIPLILCVLYFSSITILSGFAPNFPFFATMRALYGIGMGGYWGIGASFAMESAPAHMRGFFSGLMQAGYPLGYLLAAGGMLTIMPLLGWHAMFLVGFIISLVIVFLCWRAPESAAWKNHRSTSLADIGRTLIQNIKIFFYLLLVMAAMNCLSHGNQDLYPDFLKSLPSLAGHKILGMNVLYGLPIISSFAAIAGALFFGRLSETVGRRYTILIALGLGAISLAPWAFGRSLLSLLIGACLIQASTQGAFGIIPAHLNELSPASVRGLFPGLVYQLGVLIAAPSVGLEFILRGPLGYPWAMASFEATVIVILGTLIALGPEKRGQSLTS
jgi:MFS transporter, SHS family, lactate transporter